MFNIFLHNDTYYEYFIENAEVFTKNLITIYFFYYHGLCVGCFKPGVCCVCLQDVVRWCCCTGYVSVNSWDNAGYTPLHGSCIGGHISISRCLIEYDADVNAASKLDGAWYKPSSLLSVVYYLLLY